MITSSAFDILGPVMVGPSSSHTAGALRIARFALSLLASPVSHVTFTLHNSFAHTYRGHGSDRALLGGILGFPAHDPRVANAPHYAKEQGITWDFVVAGDDPSLHPNTIDVQVTSKDAKTASIRGESVGGGRIRIVSIDGVQVDIDGKLPTLIVAHKDVPGMLASMTHELGKASVNIAYMSSYRTEPGELAYAVFETDTQVSDEVIARIENYEHVFGVHSVTLEGTSIRTPSHTSVFDFSCAKDLAALCEQTGMSLGKTVMMREESLFGSGANAQMQEVMDVMKEEVHSPLVNPQRSLGGFIGGEARALYEWQQRNTPLCGDLLSKAQAYALAVLERSAAMGVIVAAPTAGSSGVVPGCIFATAETLDASDTQIREALYAAAGIGMLCETWASVSGAEGGCQAEVGTASAMAAAALATLQGESAQCALDAAGIAIANMLGLVCDPVKGLVEIPCQVRNAAGVSNAFTACDLARAGVRLPIPFDEVLGAMSKVGSALPVSLRETALGGLAACESVCTLCGKS